LDRKVFQIISILSSFYQCHQHLQKQQARYWSQPRTEQNQGSKFINKVSKPNTALQKTTRTHLLCKKLSPFWFHLLLHQKPCFHPITHWHRFRVYYHRKILTRSLKVNLNWINNIFNGQNYGFVSFDSKSIFLSIHEFQKICYD